MRHITSILVGLIHFISDNASPRHGCVESVCPCVYGIMKGRVGTRTTLRPDHVPFNGLLIVYERKTLCVWRYVLFRLRFDCFSEANRIMIRAVLELFNSVNLAIHRTMHQCNGGPRGR